MVRRCTSSFARVHHFKVPVEKCACLPLKQIYDVRVPTNQRRCEMIFNFFKENGFEAVEAEYLKASKENNSNIFQFPSEDIQVITNGLKGEATAKSGLSIFKEFAEVARQNKLGNNPRILDYGCGWGRITRLLATLSDDENVYGVDVDSRLISSANECAKTLKFSEIQSMGTMSFDTDSFDLICANSVFSHLSEESASFTLSELVRILSPNGILIISVLESKEMLKFYSNEKQRAWIEKILGSQDDAEKVLSQKNFVWGDTKRWDNYGIAIMNDFWLEANLANMSAKLVDSYRTQSTGSQNYKIIVKS